CTCCLTNPPPPRSGTLSLHDALPISRVRGSRRAPSRRRHARRRPASGGQCLHGVGPGVKNKGRTTRVRYRFFLCLRARPVRGSRSEEHTSELQSRGHLVCRLLLEKKK